MTFLVWCGTLSGIEGIERSWMWKGRFHPFFAPYLLLTIPHDLSVFLSGAGRVPFFDSLRDDLAAGTR
ncbi:MAG: hypothetical protein GTO04_01215 [Planctomycetales bacterium]|nr:hypothetical protein [Planctomycetales bacterium]